MVSKGIGLVMVLLIFGCGSNEMPASSSVMLQPADCFGTSEKDVQICLDSVVNDSRCPTGLQCVWEGDATAAFTLKTSTRRTSFNLHTNSKFQMDTLIDGMAIALLKITPYPGGQDSIKASEYRVEIRVTGP